MLPKINSPLTGNIILLSMKYIDSKFWDKAWLPPGGLILNENNL